MKTCDIDGNPPGETLPYMVMYNDCFSEVARFCSSSSSCSQLFQVVASRFYASKHFCKKQHLFKVELRKAIFLMSFMKNALLDNHWRQFF